MVSTYISHQDRVMQAAEVTKATQEKWLKENAEALASSNSFVEANGVPLARHRQF